MNTTTKIIGFFASGIFGFCLGFSTNIAKALPTINALWWSYKDDANTMAYSGGKHGIAGDQETYIGEDLVKFAGHWNYTQWFHGYDSEGNEVYIQSNWWSQACPEQYGGITVRDPYPEWGTYLKSYTDYCVKNYYSTDLNYDPTRLGNIPLPPDKFDQYF